MFLIITPKKLLSEGLGAKKKQVRINNGPKEAAPWENGVIETHSQTSLQNAICFIVGCILPS